MRHSMTATILTGLASLAVVIALHSVGIFGTLSNWLEDIYVTSGFFPRIQQGAAALRWPRFEWGLLLLAAFGIAWCMADVPRIGQKILLCLTLLVVVSGLSPTLALYGVTFPPFAALVAAVVSFLLGLAYVGGEKGMHRRMLDNVVGQRVSKETFAELLDARVPLPLQGDNCETTVLTWSILNHGELSEKMAPGDLLEMSKSLAGGVADFLMARGAYLDESGPNCVRVFFGLLPTKANHAEQACRAALDLCQWSRDRALENGRRWSGEVEQGVGIESGKVTVGVYGVAGHSYYSGMGQVVDFSRRIGMLNRLYGSTVLLGIRTHQLAEAGIEVRPMEMIQDLERGVLAEVYELISLPEELSENARKRRDVFWEAVISYREQDFEKALEKFSRARVEGGGEEDRPLEFFVGLAQAHLDATRRELEKQGEGSLEQGHSRVLNA